MKLFKKGILLKLAVIFTLGLTQFSLASNTYAESNEKTFEQTLMIDGTSDFSGTVSFPEEITLEKESLIDESLIDENLIDENQTQPIEPLGANLVTFDTTITDTSVKVKVYNIGSDPLDKVTVKVSATGYSEQSQSATRVYSVAPKTFTFDMLEISAFMKYYVTITVTDGGLTQSTSSDEIDKSYTESQLSEWHPGTYGSRAKSVDYHFGKHKNEVGAKTVTQYLKSATQTHDIVKKITESTSLWTLTKTGASGNYVAQKKYKNTITGVYITVTDTATTKILSHGK
ncbi:hypothetical protein ACIQ1H_17900 [Lysinibacillus sp. NPDC097279]|uniref:hypothetical protein n=1 Tax=Lysinibacillus sp. NPDC097279 TaxID=3364143 RepID=UPI0038304855